MIPQSFIQELLARVDVVDVVGRHVQLKKAGANFLGLCPFHGEKSPSFTVSPGKQFYHCFGCGAHGTAVGFLMEHGGLSYPEAIEELARSVGLTVPQERGGDAPRRDPDLLELMAAAARFYRQRLKDSPRAIDYLKRRGLTGETAARYGIGYAPDAWRGLEAAVPDYDSPALAQGGLVIETQGDEGRRKRYDRFRDRIMFPIRNARGQVIGFGGRVIDQGEPKYMNSPETPLFAKGRELYGLYEGRDALRERDCAIVVEGYMDVVMLAQHGVRHAVATLGTSTTPEHVRKLGRQVARIVFAFDGDAAGRKAAWRALEACLPQVADGQRVDFLFLPPEHDPDSFVREQGAHGFEQALDRAIPLSEFLLRELAERVDLAMPEGRARLLAEARPLLRAMPANALQLQLRHRVAELARVSTGELVEFLSAGHDARHSPATGRTGGPAGAGVAGRDRGSRGLGEGERGRWEDRRGVGAGARGVMLRAAARPPDLRRRVRLLSALHPALAHEPLDPADLPEDIVYWLTTLRGLPVGSSLAGVCEALRASQPDRVAELEADAGAGRAMVADMGLDEARRELGGALNQLRLAGLKRRIDALARQGLADPARRQELIELQARARQVQETGRAGS